MRATPRSLLSRLQGMLPVIQARPAICVTALMVMLVIAAVSTAAVVLAAQAEETSRRLAAQGEIWGDCEMSCHVGCGGVGLVG